MDFVSLIENTIRDAGFDHFGWAALERPLSIDIYRQWIADGQHGEMHYLSEHAEIKAEPKKLAPRALSAIVLAKPYLPHPFAQPSPTPSLRTALYAQGDDYHRSFLRELDLIAGIWREKFPGEEFLCFTDSAPILERDLAYRAGLGWVGKNTCLIEPRRGSLFFIGQILTSLPLTAKDEPVADHCGTCDRCIRACPTQAIEGPRQLNATKCISYWTIEARGPAPEALRLSLGDWFFGCDICQTVCPWNEKVFGRENMRARSQSGHKPLDEDLRFILTQSNRKLEKAFGHSPVLRARPRGLKRNALQLIGNLKLSDLRPEVLTHVDDPHLGEIARWALAQLP